MSNMHVRAYMRELGKKGGQAKGERKKRSPEQYKEMAKRSAAARKKSSQK
jgi:general stress protein YciG